MSSTYTNSNGQPPANASQPQQRHQNHHHHQQQQQQQAFYQLSPKMKAYIPRPLHYLFARILSAATRLETSTSPSLSISRLKSHVFTRKEKIKYSILIFVASFSLFVMESPSFPLKLFIPALFTLALLLPVTSQFFLPASPIFAWLILFYSARYIPTSIRPHIWVSVLPTLETILYGANISDILTRFGHPALDILAWIPYGVIHFVAPFVVAACLFVFAPPGSVKVFANSFGFLNLIGVVIQILFPCAPPWYELREGLIPANYGMRGSPAGLARIDALFHSHGYTLTFTGSPMVFGAFPSLHAATATMEALFCSYFFPVALRVGRLRIDSRVLYWSYCFWLYWCTMYLMHHYLIDLVAGGCLSTMCFYLFLPDEMRTAMEQNYPYRNSAPAPTSAAPPASRPRAAFASLDTSNTNEILAMNDLPRSTAKNSQQQTRRGDEESQIKQATSTTNGFSTSTNNPPSRPHSRNNLRNAADTTNTTTIFSLEDEEESNKYSPYIEGGEVGNAGLRAKVGQGLRSNAASPAFSNSNQSANGRSKGAGKRDKQRDSFDDWGQGSD
ncbi:PAP2-domain-containing protein [Violaceomyces palustris]|uniref:PAP2-domain-containing protein n=1 Tax=Violaceomyces palustris TaxID=1673888 RepID=A0ACD0NMA4_9BASI|nr:PAP2-domain-containing protein [Violaceomyces palustris]